MSIDRNIEKIAEEKRRFINKLQLFDANIWLGQPQYFPLAEELEVDKLQNIFKQYSIRGGLVSCWQGLTQSAQYGNQFLLDIKSKLPDNVYTIWTGLPLFPHEQGLLPGFGKPNSHLRGVRLFPKSHNYLLSGWVAGALLEWCTNYHIPLFLWHVEIDWEQVFNLAKDFPRLKIIIETQWQKILYHNRTLYNLMKACKNIFVETSNFTGQDFISHAVRTFGAHRFIFGSFLPVNDPYVSIGMLMDAEISEEQKKMIAGKNLQKIIGKLKV